MSRSHNTQNVVGDFTVPLNDNGSWPNASVHTALLADIRRELRKLNDAAPRLDLKLNDVRAELRRVNKRLRGQGMMIRGRRK